MIGSALIGIPVAKGSHTLEMTFVPGGFYQGLIISLICLALMTLTILLDRKKSSGRQEEPEQAAELPDTTDTSHVWKLASGKGNQDDDAEEKQIDPAAEHRSGTEQEEPEHG